MNKLRVAGVSHRTAAVEVRERLAVPRSKLDAALEAVRQAACCDEAVLLSTCNRVELYVAGEDADPVAGLLAASGAAGIGDEHLYQYSGVDSVRHLFRVGASLDSMVPGEAQIIGQVRNAYDAAHAVGMSGRKLHGLFQRAVRVGREVRTQTGLSAARLGVAETAAEYAQDVLGNLADKRVLCVGTGKMTALILRHLHGLAPTKRPRSIVVVGRDRERAIKFAAKFGGRGGALADLDAFLGDTDLLVCGTGHTGNVVHESTVRRVMATRPDRPLFAMDLALPRDIDAACGVLEGVHLYDLDDLQQAAAERSEDHGGELRKAEALVETAVGQYVAWHRGRDLGPTIDRLYGRSHATAAAEIDRLMGKLPSDLTPEQKAAVELHATDAARRLVNKLLHGPVAAMRHMPDPDRHAAYRHAVEKLFSLDEELKT